MSRLAWLITPSAEQIGFALRLCIAMAAALFLSMWLELDRPYWASLEVAVMIQPMPGMAVVRGFARAAGTVVAGIAGLTIVALFQQSYELSAAALTLWIAACAFGANLLRNNLSYGFAIAGFIAGVTVILSHTLSQPAFDIAVARVSECILAALCVAVVNVLLSTPRTARAYRASRLSLLAGLGREYARLAALGGAQTAGEARADDPHDVLPALAGEALALEQTRGYVSYESPGFAHFSRLARRLDYDVLSLISAASSLHLYLAGRSDTPDAGPLAALAEPARCMQETPDDWQRARAAFDTAHAEILARARRADGRVQRLSDWVIISRALDLASRGRAAMIKHGLLLAEQADAIDENTTRRSEFGQPMDLKHALRNAARTATAVGLGGLVWIHFHDQLPAVLLMILLGALTTIFSTLPDPLAAAGGFGKGLAVAVIAAFVADFLILPQANGFAMLMLTMLPFYFCAGLAMSTGDMALALPGRISAVMFSLLVHTENGALPGFTTYFQIAMGIAGAVGLTIVAFRLVLPVAPRQRLREQMRGVFDDMARGRRQTRERFETRMYDRLNSLALAEIDDGPASFSARRAVLAAINIGLEARGLRVLVERVDFGAELRDAINAEMDRLRTQFAGRRPALATVIESQRQTHGLARALLARALAITDPAERRLAIRAAVAAELMASALADYALAFAPVEPGHLALGERESARPN